MQLLWIRHAQSINNLSDDDPSVNRICDAPLTERGHQQAKRLADVFAADVADGSGQARLSTEPHLPVYRADRLLVSPMRRTLQTVAPIADALDLSVTVVANMYENGGVHQLAKPGPDDLPGGLNRDGMTDIIPNIEIPDEITADGWWDPDGPAETNDRFLRRADRVAHMLREKADSEWAGETVVVVAHGDLTDAVMKLLLTSTLEDYPRGRSFLYPLNSSVTRIDLRNPRYPMLNFFSRVSHLPLEMVTR